LCIVPNPDGDFKEFDTCGIESYMFEFQTSYSSSFFSLFERYNESKKEVTWIKSLHISLYQLFFSSILLPYIPLYSTSYNIATNVCSDDRVMTFPSNEHFKMVDTSQKG
jgi:hypothetical protein